MDEKAAGFWPAAGESKNMSADANAESRESKNRAPGGGAELVCFLRFAPTLSPTLGCSHIQETGQFGKFQIVMFSGDADPVNDVLRSGRVTNISHKRRGMARKEHIDGDLRFGRCGPRGGR
jgi:hypothetical protein